MSSSVHMVSARPWRRLPVAGGCALGLMVALVMVVLVLGGCGSAPAPSPAPGASIPAERPPAATPPPQDPARLALMRQRAVPAPEWMVGEFTGLQARTGLQNISLTVQPNGRMLGQIGDILAEGQYVGGNRVLWSHGSEWKVDRTRTGFVAAQVKDPANATIYTRKAPVRR